MAKPSAKPPCALFLFDWQPVFWSTREEYFRQLAERFTSQGIVPVLVVPKLDDAEVRRRFVAAGARIEIGSYHHGLFAYWQRIRRLRQEFSIQFAHVRFFDYFCAVPWLCRLSGVRTIFFTEANSGEWTTVAWKQRLLQLRTALMCWPLTGVIAISAFIQRRLEFVGIPPGRISVIYNGVDVSSFQPDPAARASLRQQMGATDHTVVVLFAAAFLAWKRPQVALQTCAELVRQGVDIQLWMAGKGPLKEELEHTATQLQLGDHHLKWIGYQKDPQRWMAAADVFLHTALGEAFGNVFIEAMACGLPAVASNSGSAPEIIQDRENGRLVDPGPEEAAQLAAAITETMRDRDDYASMSAAAQRTSGLFSTQISVEKTMSVYAPWL